MAVSYAVPSQAYVGTPTRGPITRLLEDERWLAVVLLLPTVILLGLFIAYPFVEGVLLSVTDAMAMGRLIREKKFATEVEAGKYCASPCPLMFAGGVERRAGNRAAIGVHQVAVSATPALGPPRDEMSIAQNISARCQRYLGDMGINLQAWVHAMETPHDRLFVFKPDELKSLNIVTAGAAPMAGPPAPPPASPKTRS